MAYQKGTALILLIVQITSCYGSAHLDLHMVNFTNTAGTYGDNTACDATGDVLCDPYFIFCVDHYLGNDNPESCLYWMHITSAYVDSNDVIFDTSFPGGVPNPFSVPLAVVDQDNVMLKVDVWDSETLNVWIDQYHVFLDTTGAAPDNSANWVVNTVYGSRPNSKTSLSFEYRVYCDEAWFGTNCATYCVSSNNPSDGFYTCDEQTGEKICDQGWSDAGMNCTVEVNECESSPCMNLGLCQDQLNGYRCICLVGVNGTHCEDNLDECESNPCQNNGVCQDDFGGYICDCTYNFYGDNCELNRPKLTEVTVTVEGAVRSIVSSAKMKQ